jgi:hypothetical protein
LVKCTRHFRQKNIYNRLGEVEPLQLVPGGEQKSFCFISQPYQERYQPKVPFLRIGNGMKKNHPSGKQARE